jgi:hypothetical protein
MDPFAMDVAHLEAGEELRDFDYSVRVNLANSSLCGDRQRSVVLKLRLERPDGSERQVGERHRCNCRR